MRIEPLGAILDVHSSKTNGKKTPNVGIRTFTTHISTFLGVCLLLVGSGMAQTREAQEKEIRQALLRSARFFVDELAVHGGYVYYYSVDGSKRWGEGAATEQQIWVQPPGTPTVGMALLRAHHATGDERYLQAAKRAAEALVYGQLKSGGWTNSIDLAGREKSFRFSGGHQRLAGNSSLDDGITPATIVFLANIDARLDFGHKEIHAATQLALDSMLKTQFANGAFPQVWKNAGASSQPVIAASFPDYDWRTEGRIKNYWDMYTLNDNVPGNVADALMVAHEIYKDPRYKTAVQRLGDFLILAQLPAPQPAWSQQYNYEMRPIWARKFEPPAIAGDESQEVIRTLLKIFSATGKRKYLQPIPAALEYLQASRLADGRLARFYELKTNRPLYMTRRGKQYRLTYDDRKLPKHYGWKIKARLTELRELHANLESGGRWPADEVPDKNTVDRIINELDARGRWLSSVDGQPLVGQPKFASNETYISSQVFSDNVQLLCRYLENLKE